MTFKCRTCGQVHDGLPDIGFQWPDHYFDVPEEEREQRIDGTEDTCSIENEYNFIRGVILIPLADSDEEFGLGVWVSQKRENFETYLENDDSNEIGPFFGWLSNEIPFFKPSTINLKTRAHFQGNNQRPLIELAPCEHPLYHAYSEGLTVHQVWGLVQDYVVE
jgi:hypothetical protein